MVDEPNRHFVFVLCVKKRILFGLSYNRASLDEKTSDIYSLNFEAAPKNAKRQYFIKNEYYYLRK